MACHNYGRFLRQALDSLLRQTLDDLEVIVIDDASSDETPLVLEDYQGRPGVRIVRHAANMGHVPTYNEGLALSRGRFVGLLSADDYVLREDAVARQVSVFEGDPQVGLVYSAHSIFRDGELVRRVIPWPSDGIRSGLEEFRSLMWGNYILHSGALLRREVFDEVGPYDVRLSHTGDWDIWLRVAARHGVGYIAEPLYAYRLHSSNMFHSALPPRRQTDEVLATIDRGFASLSVPVPPDLVAARTSVERHGLLQTPWWDLANGRRMRTWQGLAYAVRRRPAVVSTSEFWRFLPRLVLMTAVGRDTYGLVEAWADRRRRPAGPGKMEAGA
jgi:glycosyltransferase involved in cell wall biosynthesis